MDELEISGKLFISSRRAAKLHKYHSDYIGQLIRAKKVVGQKVGRSWYVDAKSLDFYFAKEGSVPEVRVAEPVLAVTPVEVVEEEVVIEKPQKIKIEEIEEAPVASLSAEDPEETKVTLRKEIDVSKKFEVEIVESEITAEEESFETEAAPVRESLHIPIRRTSVTKKNSSLRYIDDTTPALPEIQKIATKSRLSVITRMPQSAEELDAQDAQITEDVYTRTSSGLWLPTLSIVTLGVVAFTIVALGSILVNSHMVIEAGKTASVGYSLK